MICGCGSPASERAIAPALIGQNQAVALALIRQNQAVAPALIGQNRAVALAQTGQNQAVALAIIGQNQAVALAALRVSSEWTQGPLAEKAGFDNGPNMLLQRQGLTPCPFPNNSTALEN